MASNTVVADKDARDLLVEAVASLAAAGSVLSSLNSRVDSALHEFFDAKAWEIKERAFGDNPEADEAYSSDPLVVEIYARSAEIAAAALTDYARQQPEHSDFTLTALGAWKDAAHLLENARRIRGAGDIEAGSAFVEDDRATMAHARG